MWPIFLKLKLSNILWNCFLVTTLEPTPLQTGVFDPLCKAAN